MGDRIRARPDNLAVWADQTPWSLDRLRDAAEDYATARPVLATTPPMTGELIHLELADVTSGILEADAEHRALVRQVDRLVDALVALDAGTGPGRVTEVPAIDVPSIDPPDADDVTDLLDDLGETSWFTVPWTTYGLADSLAGIVDDAVYQPRIAELLQRYLEEVEVWEADPTNPRALQSWLAWQQESSQLVDLDELVRQGGTLDPDLDAFGTAARTGGGLDDAGLFVRFSRFRAVAGRVVVPLGLVLDGAVVLDEDSGTADRVAAGAGFASGGVAALAMVGVSFPPSLLVAAGVLGAASAAYGLWQLREPIADGAEWLWDHTGGAVWRGGVSVVEGIADGFMGMARLGMP